MNKPKTWLLRLQMTFLTLACVMAGYGFYQGNQHDLFTSVCFTIGILGIILSVFRQKAAARAELIEKKTPEDSGVL